MQSKTISSGSRMFRTFIYSWLAALFLYVLYSIISFPQDEIFTVFRSRWYVLNTLALFIEFFLPVQCAVILLVHSLFPRYMEETSVSFRSYVVLFTVLLILFSLTHELAYPRIKQSLDSYQIQTRVAAQLKEAAVKAEENENLESAVELLEHYMEIDTENRVMESKLNQLQIAYLKEENRREREEEDRSEQQERTMPAAADGMDSGELLHTAETYFGEGDYQTAYYYASIAVELGDPDGRELMNRAARELGSIVPGKDFVTKQELFRLKSEARAALLYGDPLDAYYLFLFIREKFPEDSESAAYLEQSKAAISKEVFYLDEIEEVLDYPGTQDILFTTPWSDSETALIAVKKAVDTDRGLYLQDMEIFAFTDEQREITAHYRVPYAKSENGTLYFHCVHRTDPEIRYTPRSLRPGSGDPPPLKIEAFSGIDMSALFPDGQENFSEQSADTLWKAAREWPLHGYSRNEVVVELLMRLLFPFSYLIFSFFTLGIGVQSRMRTGSFTSGTDSPVSGFACSAFHYHRNVLLSAAPASVIAFRMERPGCHHRGPHCNSGCSACFQYCLFSRTGTGTQRRGDGGMKTTALPSPF